MGKVQKLSKGGMIKKVAGRHYFDDGGSTTLGGPTQSNGGAATVNNNGFTGTIGNGLGLNNQFQAQGAPVQAGTNAAQLNQAYTGAQNAIAQQQDLTNQVQPGVTQGLGTQANLTGQLQGVVNGTGPNAAQTALNQNTATNVSNQAALMAGQRGASANAGLLARQAAQQGAATQQAAVGQAATQQAQQQIAAQEQLANLANTQVTQGANAVQGINNAQQNEQNILQGANTAANNANVAMQSNINNVNAGVAAGNQAAAAKTLGGITGTSVLGSFFAKGGEVDTHHCAGPHCTDRQHSVHMMADGGPLAVHGGTAVAQQGVGPWLSSSSGNASPAAVGSVELPSSGGGSGATNPGMIKTVMGAFKAKPPAAGAAASPPPAGGSPIPDRTPPGMNAPSAPGGANAPTPLDYDPLAVGNGVGSVGDSALDSQSAIGSVGAADLGDAAGGIGEAAEVLAYHGGKIPHMDDGGIMGTVGHLLPLIAALQHGGRIAKGPHRSHVANYLASGGEVPAMVSPGERYLSPDDVKRVVERGENPLKIGTKVPGKPKVKGDSLKNDTVPATLQEGGVVIPRHIMNKKSRDHAELFVRRAVHMRKPEGKK